MTGSAHPERFAVQHLACGRRHTLFVKGELDLAAAGHLEAVVLEVLAYPSDRISLNLDKLRFIDAAGLRALLDVCELCRQRDRHVSVTPATGQVRRLLELTGVDRHLPVQAPEPVRFPVHRMPPPSAQLLPRKEGWPGRRRVGCLKPAPMCVRDASRRGTQW